MDPLASVDMPLEAEEAALSMVWAGLEAETLRLEILRNSVDVEAVALQTGRSRQVIERLRREGRLLALQVGSQWCYPLWQLDPDAADGIVPALDEVLGHLALSPIGAAIWLLTATEHLGGATPIEALQRRRPQRVVQLALEQGFMP